jgi:hypothetical protein
VYEGIKGSDSIDCFETLLMAAQGLAAIIGSKINNFHHANPPARHRPEQTLLYQLVEQYYPEFADVIGA